MHEWRRERDKQMQCWEHSRQANKFWELRGGYFACFWPALREGKSHQGKGEGKKWNRRKNENEELSAVERVFSGELGRKAAGERDCSAGGLRTHLSILSSFYFHNSNNYPGSKCVTLMLSPNSCEDMLKDISFLTCLGTEKSALGCACLRVLNILIHINFAQKL